MPKYVITGGPGTGKSTTIAHLEAMGHQVLHEAARLVITYQKATGEGKLPWTDREGFQELVTKVQNKMEEELDEGRPAFLDRGIPDAIAYCRLDNTELPEELEKIAEINGYDKVFLLEMLPEYRKDAARKEDRETAEKIHSLIEETYRELGYEIEKVPVMPPEQRTRYILAKI